MSYGADLQGILSLDAHQIAAGTIRRWPGYKPTPLRLLDGLAAEAGVGAILYKDESGRFGLGSFKALGGAYAVYRLLAEELQRSHGIENITPELLAEQRYREATSKITVTCTTDGNHGRSVAWGASMFGCKCAIYLHEGVSKGREDAIASYGADVVRAGAIYDDSVKQCAEDAERMGRFVISDTSYNGYMDVPRRVMQGYSLMGEEILGEMSEPPTHVFIQGGVGGLAASMCAYFWESLGIDRPVTVVVEPENADCLYQTSRAGTPVAVEGDLDTIMAGLACGEVSLLAWEILRCGADYFMTIPDELAANTMLVLADGPFGDRPIVSGESGAAGLAGFLAVAKNDRARNSLGLGKKSRVLVFGTEGATDPEIYADIVGRKNEEVLDQ